MTPHDATVIRDFLIGMYKNEAVTTRKVIASAPFEQAGYAPSEKCMLAGRLWRHIAESEVFFLRGVANGGFSRENLLPAEAQSPAAVLAWYDEQQPTQLARVARLPGEDLLKVLSFPIGQLAALQFLGLALRHQIHHRGQLSSYLRPMGGKVPSIYGPSADEKP